MERRKKAMDDRNVKDRKDLEVKERKEKMNLRKEQTK